MESTGKIAGIAAVQHTVAEVKETVSGQLDIKNITSDSFDVLVSNVSSTQAIQEVQVPVWSNQNGQDDIVWYRASRQSDGTYKTTVQVSDHRGNAGSYSIHLYYALANGKQVGVAAAEVTVPEDKTIRTGELSFQEDDNGDFTVLVSNVSDSKGLVAVKVPVWTDKSDQDDVIWYDAMKQSNGTYKANVKLSDHNNERGVYHVHLYYQEGDGRLKGVAASKHTVAEARNVLTGTISIENSNSQGFDVVISQVTDSQGIIAVKVPVWSSQGGQDDIIWYDAVKQANGNYKVEVRINNHQNNSGDYNIHLYYQENDGKLKGVAATRTTLPASETSNITLTAPGYYTFTREVEVKNEAKASAQTQFTFNAGKRIFYDSVLNADGHQWISYSSYSGIRRYIAIN